MHRKSPKLNAPSELTWSKELGPLFFQWGTAYGGYEWVDEFTIELDNPELLEDPTVPTQARQIEYLLDLGVYLAPRSPVLNVESIDLTCPPFLVRIRRDLPLYGHIGPLPNMDLSPTFPLKHSAIHHVFACLKTPAEFAAFASKYGPLGLGFHGYTRDGSEAFGEPLPVWQQEVRGLATVLALWQRAQAPPSLAQCAALARTILAGDAPPLLFLDVPDLEEISFGTLADASALRAQVLSEVIDYVNDRIGLATRVKFTPTERHYFIVVRGLVPALYLSFANEIMGYSNPPRICANCSGFIPDDARSDAKFCSPSCRSANFVKNKAVAQPPKKRKNK